LKVGDVKTKETNEAELSQLMVGRRLNRMIRAKLPCTFDREGLSITAIQDAQESVGPISLEVPPGRIIGIAGVDGNGQKAFAELLLGIRKIKEGSLTLDGKNLEHLGVKQRRALGFGYISDDRLLDSLVLDMDMQENLLLTRYRGQECNHHHFIARKKLRELTEQAVEKYAIKSGSLEHPVRYLSGGNQQKLILARELAGNVKVVIACQPTRGLDVGSTEDVHKTLLELRSQGSSVILISSDLEEILDLSDNIAVMYRGTIVDVIEREGDVDLTYLGLLMAGSPARRNA
jgi:simple sugar transport system ATP-binding protein